MTYSETPQTTKKPAQPDALFINAVLSQLKLFIFAGHDTTAGVLCWVLHSLAEHPGAAALVRAGLSSLPFPFPHLSLPPPPT